MKIRIIAGLTAGALLVCLIYYGTTLMMLGVVLALSAYAYIEYDRLFFDKVDIFRRIRLILAVLVTIVGIEKSLVFGSIAFWLSFVAESLYHVVKASRTGQTEAATRTLAFELLGYIYIVGMFGFLVPVVNVTFGRDFLLLLFLLVFAGDTGAYFVGSLLGRHTLAKKLSPKKSVEGAVGGLLASCAAAFIWAKWVYRGESEGAFMWQLMLFAPVASALAQLGDLFESMFKRSQAQKDSGQFLPGHGGLLDRLDSVVLVAPLFYVYLTLVLSGSH